ncbi:hypothetical protein R3W88_029041 [Solanum pinnatisectum]|uniref:Uncharacterized protein n=1 Tax=Solanum pinnatisectum TaxID=50273 RepID=A0AAV9K454_9SOLN|nr:hypothetical protein R3W88_029041 [Solanum pinnatisectum]
MAIKVFTQLSGCLGIAPPDMEGRNVGLESFAGKKLFDKFQRLLLTKPARFFLSFNQTLFLQCFFSSIRTNRRKNC